MGFLEKFVFLLNPKHSVLLTECKNSGLADAQRDDGAYSLEEFDKVLKELVIIDPAHLDPKAADLQAAKSFDVPGAPAVAAVPALRRNSHVIRPVTTAVAATNTVPGPPNL